MAGYSMLLKIRRLEEECEKLGFRMGHSKHHYHNDYGDVVTLMPLADALPVYSRDAELFTGTFDDLEQWLKGVQWARTYYRLLRVVDDKKVARKEQDERNRQLVAILNSQEKEQATA